VKNAEEDDDCSKYDGRCCSVGVCRAARFCCCCSSSAVDVLAADAERLLVGRVTLDLAPGDVGGAVLAALFLERGDADRVIILVVVDWFW